MNDRIEKRISDYVTEQLAARPEAITLANVLLGRPTISEMLVAALRFGVSLGAAESGTKRSEPEWHEPIIAKEQTRD